MQLKVFGRQFVKHYGITDLPRVNMSVITECIKLGFINNPLTVMHACMCININCNYCRCDHYHEVNILIEWCIMIDADMIGTFIPVLSSS